MFSEERKEKILDFVEQRKAVKVTELSELLQISEVTVRRDLDELHNEKKLVRTHGGAIALKHDRYDLPWVEQAVRQIGEKQKIARSAFRYISDNDVILMDDSSTVQELAKLVASSKFQNLTVVTISIPVVNILLTNKDIHVIIVGGAIDPGMNSVLGGMVSRMLSEMSADKCFLGINGVQEDGSFSTVCYEQMTTKKMILGTARQRFILADHTKFGHSAFVKVEKAAGGVDFLITDKRIAGFDYSGLEDSLNLVVSEDEEENG